MENKVKKIVSTMLSAVLCVSLLSGCSGKSSVSSNVDTDLVVKVAHASSEESSTQVVCEAFKEKLEELSDGKITVQIYPNATLGSEAEMVESLQMGTLDAGTFGRHSAIDKKLDVLNLPFLFESDEQVEKVLRGEEGKTIREKLNSIMADNGIVALGWYETGFREITSNKKIESLDDLNGLLIRTPSTDTLIKSFQAWGAAPTAVDLSELYTSLKTGVVDAQENPYQLIYSNKLYEVQKYLCVTNHLTIPNQLVFSEKVWREYTTDQQEMIEKAGKYACDKGGEYNIEKNSTLMDELKNKMTVTYMDESSIQKMKDIAKENVWPDFINDADTEEIVKEIEKVK